LTFRFLLIAFIIFNYSKQLISTYKKANKSILIPTIVIIWLIGAIITLNILISPSFITRYPLFLTPVFYILISKGILDIKTKKLQTIILIFILLISSFSLYSYYSKPTKEQWKEVAQYIENHEKYSEIILFDYKSINLSFNLYYKGILEQQGLSEKKDSNIREIMKSKSGAWLIISHNRRTQDFYKKQMNNDYTLEFEKQYKGIKLYYYSKPEVKSCI